VWLGSEGPRNIALTAEIADGWLPLYYAPRLRSMYGQWLAEGFARPGARRTAATFEVAATCSVVVTEDAAAALDALKPMLALYSGGMGAREMTFHAEVFARMGYVKDVDQIQDLFLAGRREDAVAAVPRQAVADISLVGSIDKIRDELAMWEDAGVTHLLVGASDLDQLRTVAEAVLGA
jgi:alkanesulfonate monooxygenase SsuD/methylene tetrahydromethanopterin reductase-like flavin-dependent oxidoreductase (luciferase family)